MRRCRTELNLNRLQQFGDPIGSTSYSSQGTTSRTSSLSPYSRNLGATSLLRLDNYSWEQAASRPRTARRAICPPLAACNLPRIDDPAALTRRPLCIAAQDSSALPLASPSSRVDPSRRMSVGLVSRSNYISPKLGSSLGPSPYPAHLGGEGVLSLAGISAVRGAKFRRARSHPGPLGALNLARHRSTATPRPEWRE